MSKAPEVKHRELTKEESDQLVHDAFALERKIKQRVRTANETWWDLAESLYEFHELRGWKPLGYEKLEEFLAQPEIGLSRRSFFRAVQLWRDLAVTKQLPPSDLQPVDHTKAMEVLPAIMSGKVEPKKALDDAAGLSYRDVVEKYRQENIDSHGQEPDGSTPLNANDEPAMARCPLCSSWVKESLLPPQVPSS